MPRLFKRLPLGTLLKIFIGLALLILSLWGVNWDQLRASLTEIRLFWLLGVLASVLAGLWLKIGRSYILLRNFQTPTPFRKTSEAFFLGQAVNILLPSRGGDLVRLGYLSSDQPAQIPQVTAALALEKFLDLIAMTAIALGVAAYLPADRAVWVRTWLLPLSLAGMAGLAALIAFGPSVWHALRARLPGKNSPVGRKLVSLTDQFVESSLWLRQPRQILPALGFTLVIWAVMWATNQILLRGLGLVIPVSAGGLVVVLIYIGVLPAIMPGNVGPFYFFAQLGLAPFAVEPQRAVAFAILLHAAVTLTPLIAAGLVMLFSGGLRGKLATLWKTQ